MLDDDTLDVSQGSAQWPVRRGTLVAQRYRIDDLLGEGGMGVVLSATHVELGRRVAVKFLREGKRDKNVIRRFLREARAVVRVESEHVARVLDVGVHEDAGPFMVMEYLEGTDVDALLAKAGRLPVAEAIELVLQACEGIGSAHAHGIVHRDLKPANLFVTATPTGRPLLKVLDFGISKVPKGDGDAWTTTESGLIFGSPRYMSPEQIASTTNVDGRADIWSMSVVLYELLTGHSPFAAPTVAASLVKIASEMPLPPSHHRNELSPELDAVVMRGLAKSPEDRFQTIDEMAGALVAVRSASGNKRVVISNHPAGTSVERLARATTARLTVPQARGPSSARGLLLAGVATALLVAGGVALRARRAPVATPETAKQNASTAPSTAASVLPAQRESPPPSAVADDRSSAAGPGASASASTRARRARPPLPVRSADPRGSVETDEVWDRN